MHKLQSLRASSFVGLPELDLTFGQPISLFVGPNRAGKTSIRDTLLFTFTGKARNVTTFKDAGALSCGEVEDMLVNLTYLDDSGQPCVIKRNAKSASKGVEGQNEFIPYCIDPLSFIRLPARDRGRIISKVLGAGLDELVKDAIAEHIGDVNEEVRQHLAASGIDRFNVEALRKEVVELRRIYKREKEGLDLKPKKLTDFDLPADFKPEKAEAEIKKIDERIEKGRQLIADAKAQLKLYAILFDAKKRIKKAKESFKPVPEIPKEILIHKAADETVIALIKIAAEIKKCPVCLRQISSQQIGVILREIEMWEKKWKPKIKKINDIIAFNKQLEEQIKTDNDYVLAHDMAEPKIPPHLETTMADISTKKADYETQILNYRRFKTDSEVLKKSLERKVVLEELQAECDRMDTALKDGGPVKADIAAGGRTLPIKAGLLELWKMPLEWKDNGDILLSGRPIEMASESEQYMAAAIMGLALAEVGDVGFAVLDGFEILVGDNANVLFDAIQNINLCNVLVLASTDRDFSKKKLEGVEIYKVTEGVVKKL